MKQRVISAIIMVLVFVPIILIGNYPYIVFFAILGMLALKELLDLEKDIPFILKISTYFFTLCLMLYNYNAKTVEYLFNAKFMLFMVLFYFISIVLINDLKKYNYKDAIYLIGSILLIGIVFNGFIVVRSISYNEVFYLFLIATLTDSFALFAGKYFGHHKLSKISPGKTIEGSVGGSLLGSVLSTLAYLILTGFWSNYLIIFLVTLLLSVLGQIGDLFFSSIKRIYGIKDFSNLIPGHGGILDRIDSVCFILLGYILILM